MKKRIILFTIFLLSGISIHAKTVSIKYAESIARQLVNSETSKNRSSDDLTLVHVGFTNTKTNTRSSGSENIPTYYVFSKGDNKGFVIISADDVANPVLGYSDNGNYEPDNLPINFESWMQSISNEIAYAIDNQLEQRENIKLAWDNYLNSNLRSLQTRTAVEPLLKTTWGQRSPYNMLCPTGTAAGCVATAMAQIMKYYNYPESNIVKIPGYSTSVKEIPISTYNWSDMLDGYTEEASPQQQNAVAELMYHCGVSVRMSYGTSSSLANSTSVSNAMVKYFGYDKNITYKTRGMTNNTQWENMLIEEINANRPVYYGGYGIGIGHAFVCDGYDDKGLFHFNWGWNSRADGYFVTTALNPLDYTFNMNQEAIIGIQPIPRDPNSSIHSELTINSSSGITISDTVIYRGSSFTVKASVTNLGTSDFSGQIATALVDENDSILTVIGNISQEIKMNSSANISISNDLPSTFPAGDYFLRMVFKEAINPTWVFVTGATGVLDQIPVVVTNEIRTHSMMIKTGSTLSSSKTSVKSNEAFTVKAQFKNGGSTVFQGNVGIALVDNNDKFVCLVGKYSSNLSLPAGSYYMAFSINCSVPISVICGAYKLRAVAKPTQEEEWSVAHGETGTVVDVLPFTVLDPVETAWTPQSGSTDWFSGSNWSKGVPGETTKVTISQSTSYPVLSDSTKVDIIYFGTGAELKGQDLLVYNKAFVDYNFDQGDRSKHYRTRSLPLKEAYPGDFTFGSQPVVYFKVLALDPATQQAKFATVANGNVGKLAPGSGFVISTYPDAAVDKGLALSGGILRLPYFDADANVAAGVHPNQEFSASTSESTFYNPARTQSYKVTRSADAYKLADPITEVATNFVPAGKEFMALVGNPFMTSIDFSKLQNLNSNLIKDTYQIWTKEGSVEGYAGYSPEGNFGLVLTPALDNVIAPLQGFFVEQNNGATGSLTFDVTAITADSKNGILRSTPQAGNKIQIVARNTKAAVSTFVAKREYGSILLGEADSRQLINELNVAPQVYTIKACETGNALVGANITNGESAEYPIGIATTQSGQTSLTFSGMDSYDGNISFTDKVLGQTINLTGLASYEYYFDYAPKTSGNEVVPTNDRFSLRMTSATSSINDPSDFDNNQSLVVYADKGFIHATNSNGATIKEISVYNISGVLVYQASVNASSYTTSQYFKNGVYIVKVKTDSGIDHKKVIVK